MDATLPTRAGVEDHPLVGDINAAHRQQLTPVERLCKKISDTTGSPIALLLAVVVQFAWIAVGSISHWDPFPFAFLLTCSNVLQLVLIFVIAVAQRQSSEYAELRAEMDHDHISRLLYHQQVQEQLLLRLAEKIEADVTDLRGSIETLLAES
ncbi:MAG: DUF1003 domain-containing protein [Candidatus Eremiobacteraeota bacterium]|nr:DUF1003 domain-containing protein [Candidatus Eremiobacteraeota bacterium]